MWMVKPGVDLITTNRNITNYLKTVFMHCLCPAIRLYLVRYKATINYTSSSFIIATYTLNKLYMHWPITRINCRGNCLQVNEQNNILNLLQYYCTTTLEFEVKELSV